jgi:hypothetical protein
LRDAYFICREEEHIKIIFKIVEEVEEEEEEVNLSFKLLL